MIIDASAIRRPENQKNGVAILAHEIGHALMHRPSWGVDEHNDQANAPEPASNVMSTPVSRVTASFDASQCGNIELAPVIFRGDP